MQGTIVIAKNKEVADTKAIAQMVGSQSLT